MKGLSKDTWEKIRLLFPPEDQIEAGNLLVKECGNNLPFCENTDINGLERIRFAVLKLSRGNIRELHQLIDLAKIDWRDVLVAAGFGNSVEAHKEWRIK